MAPKNNFLNKEENFLNNLKKKFFIPKVFNHFEKALILKKASQLQKDFHSTFFKKICAITGVPVQQEIIKNYLKINQICKKQKTNYFKKCLKKNQIHLNLLPKIITLNKENIEALSELICKFSLNLNQTNEVFNLLEELAKKESLSIKNLINKLNLLKILKVNAPPDQKIKKLKELLFKKRYPLLSSYEKKAQKILKKLELPEKVHLKPPKFFENSNWQLLLEFKKANDLKNFTYTIKKILKNKEFLSFLKKTY